jgi:hypothetical protein
MVINFRAHKISRDACKLIQTFILIIKKNQKGKYGTTIQVFIYHINNIVLTFYNVFIDLN